MWIDLHSSPEAGYEEGGAQLARQEIAASFAVKASILLSVVAAVLALWAVTSQPVSVDATLGTPIVGEPQAGFNQATVDPLPD